MTQTDPKRFIRHTPCEQCGSSDANALYADGSRYCFSCRNYTEPPKDKTRLEELLGDDTKIQGSVTNLRILGNSRPIEDRGISQEVCGFYNVTITNPDKHDLYKHHYPYYSEDGNLVAIKVRRVANKSFTVEGKVGKATLFGQHLFSATNNTTITICEGEIDALSVSQMLPKRYPVVSVRTGAAGAITDCKKQYEFLNSFEKIYLCFDNDEPGREASRRVAELFPPKKVHIVNLSLKDANEYLIQGKQKDFISRF